MQPGELYILAIVVTALFVAPYNGMARVIVLSWIVAHVLYSVDVLPETLANIAGQLCVAVIGKRHMHSAPASVAWLLSFPLLAFNGLWLGGALNPVTAWWLVLCTALAQLLVLPMGIEKTTIRAVNRAWNQTEGRGLLKVFSQ